MHLGVVFSKTGSFVQEKNHNAEKAIRAMYDVLKKGRLHNLSIQSQFDLFDKIIQSILIHGCEVWDTGNTAIIERVHLNFYKYFF